ncbi:11279_t:CDS:2, partial [Entrophospora sp. SA101]
NLLAPNLKLLQYTMGNILEMLDDESKSAHYNKIAEKKCS